MGLVKCVECGKDISQDATACPVCGKPRSVLKAPVRGSTIVIAIIGMFLVVGYILRFDDVSNDKRALTLPSSPIPPAPAVKTAATAPAILDWHELASWKGSGAKTTESFQAKSEWRIRWKTSNEVFAGAGILQIMVYDSAGKLASLAANKQGVGSDTSYVRGPAGKYYLEINSGNVDWEIVAEGQ